MEVGEDLCFPQLTNTSCRKPESTWTEVVFLQIMLSSISLLTAALNLFVIISVSHFKQLHTPTNTILLSLAVSDFLLGLLLMPAEIIRNTGCWFLDDLMCSLYNSLSFVITSASVGDMVLISVDRYVAICDPLHYPTRVTERKVKIGVCLCWLFSVVYGCLVVKEDFIKPGRHKFCVGECIITVDFIAGTVDLIVSFVIPVTIIIVLYMRVFVVAVSQARAMRSHITALSVTTAAKKSELKAARTLGVLVLVFLLCFCPYYCFSLAGEDAFSSTTIFAVYYLFYLNSCVNPVIYALFYPWFRKTVKLIVTFQILKSGSCESKIL
ncbi:trace amine-associated receptor 13c-like [Fundulus heteroclitus]|uniref:trace amine-associated receptor 13c-like n=1 Tax=Fundulus heteroclitus TaxID=8078 RepID=UPI00165AF578|nr:trace amine-associated receptor 13c-like [Fundulus heteroclitus]